jgi:hypothetical protein
VDGAPAMDRAVDAVAGKIETLTLTATAQSPPPYTPPPSAASLPPERTAPSPSPAPGSDDGLSPAWFWASAGITAVVAGVATWSTIDLFSKRSEFDDASCASVGSASCRSIADDGKSADTRSVILWTATGVLGAATAVTGLFLVRWSPAHRIGVAPAAGGAAVSFAGSWQ